MLSSLGGADSLEILVQLRDLSTAGLTKLERNIATTEAKANATNFGGFSKASKGLAADAEAAAGKTGGGGLMSMLGGFVGLPGPIAAAGLAVGAFAALGAATIPVYEKVHQQEMQLAVAFKDHGESLDKLKPKIEEQIKVGEQYAFNADDTRGAILKLTEAGMSFADIQANLPHVMDLARAKHLDLADAARMYELALMGNARALKDLGIALPKVIDAEKVHEAATDAVTAAQAHLDSAQQNLTDTESLLAGKTKLTTGEQIRLRDAHAAVDDASKKLKASQDALAATQDTAATKAARMKLVNDGLTSALGDQRGTATDLQKAQAKLGDAWEKFSVVVAPALVAALGFVINALSTLVGWIADAVSWFGSLFTASDAYDARQKQAQAGLIGRAAGGQGLSHRAAGGPVFPGGSYTVGEEGPERLDIGPGGMGMVTPLTRGGGGVSSGMSGGWGGGSGGTSTIHVHLHLDGKELAYAMEHPLGSLFALRGTSARLGTGG
jgi:hypothetical protein